ncbi:saccharopine dehydrogenase NADP-binding domain-containing protein [Pontixanthobacter aestiaquae]|uniref:Saccharopine dehydrogenase n=1 Tax=Pontixanthobacter aestiaquae TaxID=1509367 RepID=A0A844Z3B7_9SPHN|nr:saccharopine dehydrogenase NADP-binding domain-containing protein [Pontixanthobacter aestiaquae]MDN3646590.1 saccharopine dehydrogenase NADP-binding domain-containing protein [Pontixanthobacter aestiaquae]MXO82425.1 saccharopine dehydrogenase [Pontixanthobacter aestiaquae]
MSKENREFDIVVYGATGYTGRLVAEYLVQHYGDRKDAPKWAMAGRNQSKLEDVRDLIGAPKDTPLIVADASDPDSLTDMVQKTKVVLTTVGPYQLYGNELVEACAREGTDYTDLCGEPGWMREMIDKHEDLAKASGARICFSSGFDSIPFDLGVLMLQNEAKAKFGKPAPRVKGRVRAMAGTFSGGTAASLTATMKSIAKNPKLIPILQSSFGLTPGFEGPSQPSGLIPEYDKDLGKWAAPFIMAAINTKNVHRTNFLLGHPYGEDFKYDEMMLTSAGEMGEKAAKAAAEMLKNPFGAKPPKPGEGPTKEERENGFYDVLFIGEMPDGETIHYGVKGKYDPGYGSTSRMITETAIGLLESDADGGIGTPGSFLGEALVKRLEENAELTFAVE